MKKILFSFLILLVVSCAEKLMEKPNNLISKEKMVLILNDLAIVNAAKNLNASTLSEQDISPMPYIFEKYNIDSLQFVESDRYYASLPELHEEIYQAVVAKLEKEEERVAAIKKLKDSLKTLEKRANRKQSRATDSLSKSVDKKK